MGAGYPEVVPFVAAEDEVVVDEEEAVASVVEG